VRPRRCARGTTLDCSNMPAGLEARGPRVACDCDNMPAGLEALGPRVAMFFGNLV